MASRFCRCGHAQGLHKTVMDPYSRDGSYEGKCTAKDCDCKRYNFDYERWVREDERIKVLKEKGPK